MKNNYLQKTTLLFLIILTFSCSKDKETTPEPAFNVSNVQKNNKMEIISEIILEIGENQMGFESSGRNSNNNTFIFLPQCVTVTTVTSNDSWSRTIDFGTSGCEYYNGAILKGKIIYTGSVNDNPNNCTINYNFDNFYYDDILVIGNKNFTKSFESSSLSSEDHPISSIDIDLSFTFPDNETFQRTGVKTREMIEGYDTYLNIFDNKYLTTGQWETHSNGNLINNGNIQTPLENKSFCPYIVSGVIELNSNGNNSIINYGNGNCDNTAELIYNGGSPIIIHL